MSKQVERIKQADLEKKVAAYARNHPNKNLLVHGGPVAGACLAGLGVAIIGLAPQFITLVLAIGVLWFIMGVKSFNAKAVAAANSPDAELKEKRAEAAKAEAKVKSFIESQDVVRTEPLSEYDCPNYEQVTWDMRLVNEKVIPIADVSVCDMRKCFLCAPIKADQRVEAKRIRDEEIRQRQIEYAKILRDIRRRQGERATESDERQLAGMSEVDAERVSKWHSSLYNKTDYDHVEVDDKTDPAIFFKKTKPEAQVFRCPEHGEKRVVNTWFWNLCPEHRLEQLFERDRLAEIRRKAEAKATREAASAEKKRQFQERRKVNVNGVHILRPMEVPEGAVPSILNGRDLDPFATHSFIVWKWTEDGKETKFFKQPIAIDAYSVSSDYGVIKTFYSAHDPETGEYLGDYSSTAESEKMKAPEIPTKAVKR